MSIDKINILFDLILFKMRMLRCGNIVFIIVNITAKGGLEGSSMKARVKPARAAALIYGFPAGGEAAGAIAASLAGCGIEVREILPQQAGCLVGDLADGRAKAEGPVAQAPCTQAVLFNALSKTQLNEALAALRTCGVTVPLKAVITATSRTWTLAALLEELNQEHAIMHGGDKP